MDVNTIKKLKVAELRAELTRRGLDSKGTKPVLVERLVEAVNAEESSVSPEQPEESVPEEVVQEEQAADDEQNKEPEKAAVEEVEPMSTEDAVQSDAEIPPVQAAAESTEPVVESEETKETQETPKMETESAEVKDSEQSTAAVEEMVEGNHVETTGEKVAEQSAPVVEQESTTTKKDTPSAPRKTRWGNDERKVEEPAVPEVEEEPEVELDDDLVVLDHYNCDLHLVVSSDGLSAQPLAGEGFQYLWAGARGTWGVKTGKVFYECKVASLVKADIPDTEEPKQAIRIGWSLDTLDLQLGEGKNSYGYESTGKSCKDSEFTEYGQAYTEGDVIGCYLDLESTPHTVSYSKNGESLGQAFEFSAEENTDAVWFPHVLVKNAQCTMNFGSQEEAWFAPSEGYTFLQKVAQEERVHAVRGPKSKSECEVLMMIGLPASGKTTWVKKTLEEQADKKYNVIGTNTIFSKMKINGVQRKKEDGDYEKLMDKTTKCLNILFDHAARKKRNFILDQTNCHFHAQKRKMRPFRGYRKKAIILIPTNEVLNTRMEAKKEKESVDIPSKVIEDMKGNFHIPRVGEYFDELVFVEENAESSHDIVKSYHKEFQHAAGGRSDHRHRQDYRSPPHRSYNRRDDHHDFRRGGSSWGQPNYHQGGGSFGRGGGGGYRPQRGYDNRQFRQQPYNPRGGNRGRGGYDNRQRDNRQQRGGYGSYNKPYQQQSGGYRQQQYQQQSPQNNQWNQQSSQSQGQQQQWNQGSQYSNFGNYNWGNYQQQYSQQYPQQQQSSGQQQSYYGQQYGQNYNQQQYPQYNYSQYGQYNQQ